MRFTKDDPLLNTKGRFSDHLSSRGTSIIFFTGRLRPEVHPLTLLHAIFGRKGTPFSSLLLTNGAPIKNLVVLCIP